MIKRKGIADEQPSSLGGWLFADLFLLLIVVGFSAFTSNPKDPRPVVVTEDATGISMDSAVLNGSVAAKDQETSVGFEWGTSPQLDDARQVDASDSPVSGKQVTTPFQVEVSSLDAGTTYYFRAIAENESGKAVGKILPFETLKIPPTTTTTIVCNSDGPRFLKDPFVMNITNSGVNELLASLTEYAIEQKLSKPKVAVAEISGWTKDPSGSAGQRRARELYRKIQVADSGQEFFYEDTALSPWQKSKLAIGHFDVVLYLVDLAEDCRP